MEFLARELTGFFAKAQAEDADKPAEEEKKKEEKPKPKPKGRKKEKKPDPRGEEKKREAERKAQEEAEAAAKLIEKWHEDLMELTQYKVIKFPRVWQAVFYLLGYEREQICWDGTNMLWWKKAHKLVDEDFLAKLMAYNPIGAKPGDYKAYQICNFLETYLEGITQDDVDAYSLALGRLYRWVTLALEARHDDCLRRTLHNM